MISRSSIIFLFVCAVAFFIVVNIVVAYAPYNPLKNYLPISERNLKTVITQGWNFFTKNPRDPQFFLYKKQDNQWVDITRFPNSRIINFMGLSRKSRAQGLELGIITTSLNSSGVKWDTTRISSTSIRFDLESKLEINNFSPLASICGEILVVKKERIPWAWAKNINSSNQQKAYLLVTVNCRSEIDN